MLKDSGRLLMPAVRWSYRSRRLSPSVSIRGWFRFELHRVGSGASIGRIGFRETEDGERRVS